MQNNETNNNSRSLYSEKEEVRNMHRGGDLHLDHDEELSLINEVRQLGSEGGATPMSLERARSISLELAKYFITAAGNLEHVIWEMGGHRSLRYNPGLDPLKVETESKTAWKHIDEAFKQFREEHAELSVDECLTQFADNNNLK